MSCFKSKEKFLSFTCTSETLAPAGEILLHDGTWFRFEDKANQLSPDNWKGLINRQNTNPPIITPQEAEILEKGHFKAK